MKVSMQKTNQPIKKQTVHPTKKKNILQVLYNKYPQGHNTLMEERHRHALKPS